MPQYRQSCSFQQLSLNASHSDSCASLLHERNDKRSSETSGMCLFFSPVREGCDDQPAVVSKVFVPVQLDCVDHLARDRSRFSRKGRLAPLLPVVPVREAF